MLTYKIECDSVIINDKYLIDKSGTVYYADDYIGRRGDFPQYVFTLRDLILDIIAKAKGEE